MKKKIGNLSYEEMQEICKYQDCKNCPLNTNYDVCMLTLKDNGYFDREIEVKEE